MELKEILRLMAKKYPSTGMDGIIPIYPALLMNSDGSGRIVKDPCERIYGNDSNLFFSFHSIKELIQHLQGDSK